MRVDEHRDGAALEGRDGYRVFRPLATRWADNDHYGHINNVVYYALFDTAVNGHLIAAAGADIRELAAIGIVAETSCRFLHPMSFPDPLEVGLAVEHLGPTSVVYRVAVFRQDGEEAAAVGRFVHVYVDRATRTPTPIPEVIRTVLAPLVVETEVR